MTETTMIGPISKKLRTRLKVFLAETGYSYEAGLVYLLTLYDQLKPKD